MLTYTVTPSANNCTGTPVTFTITINPTPTVTAAPTSQAVCNGAQTTPVTFTGTVSGTTFSWSRSDNTIGGTNTGTGNVPAFTAVNTGTISVTSTYMVTPTANGCTGTPTTFTITVNPGPIVTISPSAQTVCNGSATQQVNFSSTITPTTTYSWTRDNNTIGGANSGTTSFVPSFTATNTTTGVITVTYTVVSSVPTGCGTSTKTFTITVNPSPKVQLTGTQNVCFGNPANLTVTFQGTAPYTFSYTSNGTNTQTVVTSNNPYVFTVTPFSNTTYKIVSASDGICTSQGGDITPSTAVVTVKPLPTATIQAGADQTICTGSAANIPIVFTGGAPYTLTYSDGTSNFVVTSPGNTYTLTVFPTSGTVTYTLVSVTDAIPCTGNVFGNAVVTVNPTTVGGTAGPNQYFCSANNSGAVSLAGQTGTVVKWQRSSNGGTTYVDLPANTTTTQTFSNLATGTYLFRAQVQSGVCAPAFSNPATITVNVITGGAVATGTTCNNPGNNGTVTVTGTGGTLPLSYSLSGGTLTSTITNSTGVFTGLGAGTYTYSITDATPCTGVTGTVVVTSPTPVVLNPLGSTNVSCFGGINGTIMASASGGTGTKTYTIISGPVINTTGQTSGTFTGLLAGTYTVQAKDANNCTSNTQSVTINQPSQTGAYDINFSADASSLTFTTPTSFTDIVFTVFSSNNNAATNDTIFISKFRNNPYVYSFLPSQTSVSTDGGNTFTPVDNSRWSLVDPGPGFRQLYLIQNNDPAGVNQIPCGVNGRVSVRLTRNTTNNSTFSVTWNNKYYPGETATPLLSNNNSASLGFSAQ